MERDNPISFSLTIIEAIAYFLAGSFVIQTLFPKLPPIQANHVDYFVTWFVIIIGILLIGVGFISTIVASPPLSKFIESKLRKNLNYLNDKYNQYRRIFMAILFSITMTQIIPVIFDFKIIPLAIVALVFLVFVLFSILSIAWVVLMKNFFAVLQIDFLIVFCTVLRVLQGAPINEIIIDLIAIGILLLFVIIGVQRRKDRNLPTTID